MIPFLDLRLEYQNLQEQVKEAVGNVLESGRYILGERLAIFEREFAEFCGARFGVGVASGTEALQIALLACGVGRDDEVITVPFTAVSTALAISAVGARPVFVDVDNTCTLNPAELEQAITPRTKAIIPVHLYGFPARLDPILEIANRHRLSVIEDACQAHGTEYKGRRTGGLGTAGCFSFYPTKNLGCYGDGGMVVTNDPVIYEKALALRNLGQDERFSHIVQGLNSRLDEIQAAILSAKLPFLITMNQRRAELAQHYRTLLQHGEIQLPPEAGYAGPNHHLFVIRTGKRNDLKAFLSARGIETDVHYPRPIHLQPAYGHLRYSPGQFPVSEQCSQEVLSLPLYPALESSSIEEISHSIKEFFSRSSLR